MLIFTYKRRRVAYMPLEGATVAQIRAARSLAADMAGSTVTSIRVFIDGWLLTWPTR